MFFDVSVTVRQIIVRVRISEKGQLKAPFARAAAAECSHPDAVEWREERSG